MFADRVDAGRRLAEELASVELDDPVILALPRGGLPVADEVARVLRAPLDVLVVRKLGVPWHPEYAFGAMGEDGATIIDRDVVHSVGLDQRAVDAVVASESSEMRRRVERYRGGRSKIDITGRTVVVVDDGLATGSTMAAAVTVVKHWGAARIVVAVPVGSVQAVERIRSMVDEIVCVEAPIDFRAVGLHYRRFDQTSDEEVLDILSRYRRQAEPDQGSVGGEERTEVPASNGGGAEPIDAEVEIDVNGARLGGHLTIPARCGGVVIFAHGSGSSRHSPRNQFVARVLNDAGLGTLLFDLLTDEESRDRANVFDIGLLAGRLVAVTEWLAGQGSAKGHGIGYFGASTGAAAALVAAAALGDAVSSVVSRGGRPDLAGAALPRVTAPTLLIVGSRDYQVLDLNRAAQRQMTCESEIAIVPGATHLFEEPGTLDDAARLAAQHFAATLGRPAR